MEIKLSLVHLQNNMEDEYVNGMTLTINVRGFHRQISSGFIMMT